MGLNRIEATRFAFENAAAAMYQSNFVVGFGLAAFGISAFMPTRRFGLRWELVLSTAGMAGFGAGDQVVPARGEIGVDARSVVVLRRAV